VYLRLSDFVATAPRRSVRYRLIREIRLSMPLFIGLACDGAIHGRDAPSWCVWCIGLRLGCRASQVKFALARARGRAACRVGQRRKVKPVMVKSSPGASSRPRWWSPPTLAGAAIGCAADGAHPARRASPTSTAAESWCRSMHHRSADRRLQRLAHKPSRNVCSADSGHGYPRVRTAATRGLSMSARRLGRSRSRLCRWLEFFPLLRELLQSPRLAKVLIPPDRFPLRDLGPPG
jgi:hypothetical protein